VGGGRSRSDAVRGVVEVRSPRLHAGFASQIAGFGGGGGWAHQNGAPKLIRGNYLSFIFWQRMLLHTCFNILSKTHLCSNSHYQTMKEKWIPPDENCLRERKSLAAAGRRSTLLWWFRGGLVFKAHRLWYHSTLGLRVINQKREEGRSWIGKGSRAECLHQVVNLRTVVHRKLSFRFRAKSEHLKTF